MMEYALLNRRPELARDHRDQLRDAIRGANRAVLDADERVIHVCDAVRKEDYYCISCDVAVRRRTEGSRGEEQFYHQSPCQAPIQWPPDLKTSPC